MLCVRRSLTLARARPSGSSVRPWQVKRQMVTDVNYKRRGSEMVSLGFSLYSYRARTRRLRRGTPQGSMGRLTVLYNRCPIDVLTHTGPCGIPMGPPGHHRDPTGPQRTAGGSVGPCSIGASQFDPQPLLAQPRLLVDITQTSENFEPLL